MGASSHDYEKRFLGGITITRDGNQEYYRGHINKFDPLAGKGQYTLHVGEVLWNVYFMGGYLPSTKAATDRMNWNSSPRYPFNASDFNK